MQLISDFIMLLAGISAVFIATIWISYVMYEIGHMVLALLLHPNYVCLYLCVITKEEAPHCSKIGRLIIYWQINPLKWRLIRCVYETQYLSEEFNIILSATLYYITYFLCTCSLLFIADKEGLLEGILFMNCLSCGIVLLYVLNSNRKKAKTNRKFVNIHKRLDYLIDSNKLAESVEVLEMLIANGYGVDYYSTLIFTLIQIRHYEHAKKILLKKKEKYSEENVADRSSMALVLAATGHYEEAINYYQQLFADGVDSYIDLYNYAYTLLILDRAKDALPYFDKVISIDNNFALAYSNRAMAKIMLGQVDESKADNEMALSIAPDNADAHRNIGIYLMNDSRYNEALAKFEMAKEIDAHTLKIDHYLTMAREKIIA